MTDEWQGNESVDAETWDIVGDNVEPKMHIPMLKQT